MENNLKEYLNNMLRKDVVIRLDGFIKARYLIKKMRYIIQEDIITIKGKGNNNNLQININQIFDINKESNKIILKLDNDLTIFISLDN